MTYDWEAEHVSRRWGMWPAESMVRQCQAFLTTRDHHAPQAALDIGTGAGANLRLLESMGVYHTVACDISRTACDRVAKLYPAVMVKCGDINSMEFAPDSFDLIIDSLCLTHVHKPDWSRVLSWLRPGGWLITAQFFIPDASFPPSWHHEMPMVDSWNTKCLEVIRYQRFLGGGSLSYTVDVRTLEKPL